MDDPRGASRRNFIKLAAATTLVAGASRDAFGSMATHLIEPRNSKLRRHRLTTDSDCNDRSWRSGNVDTNAALRRSGPSTEQANPNPLGLESKSSR